MFVKKTIFATCLAISTLIPTAANAAYYAIQSGDTLQSVAAKTGRTVNQLHDMNEISDADFIVAGHVLQYISADEEKLAIYYLKQQQKLLPNAIYRERFGWQLEQLQTDRIAYSIAGDVYHNVFFGNVLMFAQDGQKLVNSGYYSYERLIEVSSR